MFCILSRTPWPTACLTLGLLVAGCSKGLELIPVTGSVTLDGKPIAGATVTFAPKAGGLPATGVTDDEGRFDLTTSPHGRGAMPGDYSVVVSLLRYKNIPTSVKPSGDEEDITSGSGAGEPEIEVIVPVKYNNPATSGLSATVQAGNSEFKFALSST